MPNNTDRLQEEFYDFCDDGENGQEEIWDWIQENFISRNEVEKTLKELHGGGNARRLLTQLLSNQG